VVRCWLERAFPVVQARSLEPVSAWQVGEALAVAQGEADYVPTDGDVAAAAVYPSPAGANYHEVESSRLMLNAARTPASFGLTPLSLEGQGSDVAALAIHQAVETARQRRTLAELKDAITVERDREREEFRAALASLAAELRDLDSRAEQLAREVRARDETIANLEVVMSAEAERSAALSRALADTSQRLASAEARAASFEATADAHGRFRESRAGRALARYTRVKAFLTPRH
jgi:hypothetical protein